MYKITLFDYNCPSCVSGVAEFFVDNIKTFQKEWFRLERDEGRKQRFLESLDGKLVTDYYSDDASLNIVQEDAGAKILYRRTYAYDVQRAFMLSNAYDWTHVMLADQATFWIRGIRFLEKYYLVGKYKLEGVSRLDSLFYGPNIRLCRCEVFGNCILKTRYQSFVGYEKGKPLYDVTDLDNFKEDTIESICYLPMREFKTREELRYFFKEAPLEGLFENLMRDIPGDAG